MVFQQFKPVPNMTVRGNLIEAPTRVLGLSADEANARAVELLELVGLAEKIDAHPTQLSGGQQRGWPSPCPGHAPGCAAARRGDLGAGPGAGGRVLNLLRDLGSSTDITFLCVTHEMASPETSPTGC